MNTTKYFFLILIFGYSCKNSSENEDSVSVVLEKGYLMTNDTIFESSEDQKNIEKKDKPLANEINKALKNDSTLEILQIENWAIEDFIIKCAEHSKAEVRQDIEYWREEWADVKNPFIATYKGNDFGDYHHITFEDSNKKKYDFGFGNNNFGDILLYFDDKHLNDNPKYLSKTFKVYWDWKVSSFPCCSGDYNLVEAYVPSITKLELLETNINKK